MGVRLGTQQFHVPLVMVKDFLLVTPSVLIMRLVAEMRVVEMVIVVHPIRATVVDFSVSVSVVVVMRVVLR